MTSTRTCSGESLLEGGADAEGLKVRCFSRPPLVAENCQAFIVDRCMVS